MTDEARTQTAATWIPRIVGRSSSHFTRVVRIFAEECAVPYEFQVVSDLMSSDVAAYGGNPAMRLPNLVMPEGAVFGSLGSCRTLVALAERPPRVVWPETTSHPSSANAVELSVQAMSTEVSLIMLCAGDGEGLPYAAKLKKALDHMLDWLDANVDEALASLPERDLSYLEVSLFCLIEHLEFRQVKSLAGYRRLAAFRTAFAERASARATPFEFDR